MKEPTKAAAPILAWGELPWYKADKDGDGYETWHWRKPEEHVCKRPDGSVYTDYASPSYNGLIESAGLEIVVQEDQNDYQGDTLMIVRYGSKYGFGQYGWGSCSGCDALQAASNEKDLLELRESIVNSIMWFASKASVKLFIEQRDWQAQSVYHTEAALVEAFKAKVQDF